MDKIKKYLKKVKYELELYTMTNPTKAIVGSFVLGVLVGIIVL